MIPPESDAEFAASMEDVLDVYARPYDSRHPVVCMDEQPIQLLKETRPPIAGTRRHARRVDYEYERAGTASIFMFCEPLSGWRRVSVRPRRTKVDWAQEVEELVRIRYASAERVILVSDNLNTHTKGAFYEVFEPRPGEGVGAATGILPHAQARQLAEHRRKRIEFDDPPMHRGPSIRHHRVAPRRDGRLARSQQRTPTRGRLAVQGGRCPDKTEVNLPEVKSVTKH